MAQPDRNTQTDDQHDEHDTAAAAALKARLPTLPRPDLPEEDATTIALLRLLGRLELAQTPVLRALVFPHVSPRTMYYRLEHLTQRRYIWMEQVAWNRTPARHGRRQPPPKQPQVWGLTPRGRDLLRDLGVEPDQPSLDALKTRDLRQQPLSPLTLTHDLLASWWCAACLLSLRDNALTRSVFCQVEFVSHARQRMDALLIIRLRPPQRPRPAEEIGTIPWFDGTDRRSGEIELRLALEVDRGTEQLVTLLEKAICYRDLHADGTYTRVLGGPVLPVFLVPPGRRGGQIAREWQDAWEEGWGVSATVAAADHPQHGPLWGTYQSMRLGDRGKPVPLLTRLVVTSVGKVQFHPAVTREQWLAHHHQED